MNATCEPAKLATRKGGLRQFRISVASPAERPVQCRGRWIVAAEDGEHAIAALLPYISPKLWPPGSDWKLEPLGRASDAPRDIRIYSSEELASDEGSTPVR
jgi:hypothetical protein